MVSLKSFKLINEGERDETSSGSSSDQNHQSQRTFLDSGVDNARAENLMIFNGKQQVSGSSTNKEISKNKLAKSASKQETIGSSYHLPNEMTGPNNVDVSNSMLKVTLSSNNRENAIQTLQASSGSNQQHESLDNGSAKSVSPSSSSISIVVVQHGNSIRRRQNGLSEDEYTQDETSNADQSLGELDDAEGTNLKLSKPSVVQVPIAELGSAGNVFVGASGKDCGELSRNMGIYAQNNKGGSQFPVSNSQDLTVSMESEHFEIVWSNLSYKIEPKWYKKINFLDKAFSHLMPGQTIDNHSSATSTASSSAGMKDNQHQMHTSANADSHLHNNLNVKQKSPLDPIEIFTNLNGTIKSGQMTAVLGPSGKYSIDRLFFKPFLVYRK